MAAVSLRLGVRCDVEVHLDRTHRLTPFSLDAMINLGFRQWARASRKRRRIRMMCRPITPVWMMLPFQTGRG
jgi:hypothetical protein